MTIAPIRRQIVVGVDPDRAFRAWTEEIGQWWPLEPHSVHGRDGTVAFEDGRIVERSAAGDVELWGTVLEQDPPRRIRFTWHPGRTADAVTEVEVTFVPVADGRTLVTLVHSGWEAWADAASIRASYRNGWPTVLDRLAEALPDPDGDDLWFVLAHAPGPTVGPDGVFAHPLFSEHLATIRTFADAGVLVAAGPLPDEPGHGQTIIRVPASDVAAHLATAHADPAVTGDLLDLTIRPWQVVSG